MEFGYVGGVSYCLQAPISAAAYCVRCHVGRALPIFYSKAGIYVDVRAYSFTISGMYTCGPVGATSSNSLSTILHQTYRITRVIILTS